MHTDGETAGTRIDVLAGKRALRVSVELALGIERQGMRGKHRAAPEHGEHLGGDVCPGCHGKHP